MVKIFKTEGYFNHYFANCSWDEVHAGKEIEVLQVERWERLTFDFPLYSAEIQHGAN